MRFRAHHKASRPGTAAVEFAFCFAFILLPVMAGMWEVGRIVEIQQVAFNAAREGSRSASTGAEYLDPGVAGINPGTTSGSTTVYTPNVANDVLTYLQAAEPQAFSAGTGGSWATASANVLTNGTGYIYSDSKGELFTVSFVVTNAYSNTSNAYSGSGSSCTDPFNANRLDQFQFQISIPYRRIALSPLAQFFSGSRLNTVVTWVSMKDTPYQTPSNLPAS
jgi:Flp pilus assembly protein TadG